MRRWIITSVLLTCPMLAGCCCGGPCGYRLFCRPCLFGRGCGPACGGGGCATCGDGGYGANYPAGMVAPGAGPGGPIITTPAPPPAVGQPIDKLTSAQHVPTKTLR
jgi:hypothetical protein